MNGARGDTERLRVRRERCPWNKFQEENRGRSVTTQEWNAHREELEVREAQTRGAQTSKEVHMSARRRPAAGPRGAASSAASTCPGCKPRLVPSADSRCAELASTSSSHDASSGDKDPADACHRRRPPDGVDDAIVVEVVELPGVRHCRS